MALPFIDLKTQLSHIENEIREAINGVLTHGRYIMGPEIGELESKLAEWAGMNHVVSCSSGTDALLLPLMAYGVGPGDAVFTTPFTFIATAEVISLLGATPVFVDIDSATYNIDPAALADTVAEVKKEGKLNPKGIIPVDLFGLTADYDPIMDLAKKENLFVLEDAAQSFGATYKGRQAGSLGHVAATSFFPAKPLGCYGDGGAVFVNDDELHQVMTSIRVHGQGTDKYENARIGLNARMDSMQAAILLVKLSIFEKELAERQRVAKRYSDGLKDVAVTPTVPEGYVSAWAQYSLQVDDRSKVQAALKEADVPTAIYYPKSLHQQTAYKYLEYKTGDFPVSEAVSQKIFSLPMHPYLADDKIDFIVETIIGAVKGS